MLLTLAHRTRLGAERQRPARPPRALRISICVLFALVMTLAVVQYSFRHGRLIAVPSYDDIGYFADCVQRLERLYMKGIPGSWAFYRASPPHSPFQSAFGTAAFGIFGVHEWAPYAMNGLLALVYFLFLDWLLQGVKLWQKIVLFLFFATIPFVGMAIHEFRPDHAVTLFTSIGAFILLSKPFIYGPRRRQVIAGAWFGIAMLTKPPVFPQTIVLGGMAMVLATLSDCFGSGQRAKLKDVALAWTAVLVPFILIPLPHYALNHKAILGYINEILFGAYKDSYALKGSLGMHLGYYINGQGGMIMLGTHAWILAAMLVFNFGMLLVLGSRRTLFRVAAMIAIVALAWLIPTVNKTKQHFFGLGFDTMLAFAALYSTARLLSLQNTAPRRRRRARGDRSILQWRPLTGVTLLVTVLGIWYFQWPINNGNVNTGWQIQRRQLVESMFQTLYDHATFGHADQAPLPNPAIADIEKVNTPTPSVLFCAIGDFNPSTVTFYSHVRQNPVSVVAPGTIAKAEGYAPYMDNADFIFCAEPGTLLCADFLPVSFIQQQLLDMVRARPEFQQIGKWNFVKSTHSMYLFARAEFYGFTPISGLGDREGPFPNMKLNVVRWGYGPATRLKVTANHSGSHELRWFARNQLADQIVTVKLDGKNIDQRPMPISLVGQFPETKIPLDLSTGEHELELQYSKWSTTKGQPPMAVLFKHLQVYAKQ